MPVSAVWLPMINAMMFPHLAERHTLRENIAIGYCLDDFEFGRIRRIQRGRASQVANMGVIYEPGDQAFQTDLFLSIDRDALVDHGNGIAFTLNRDPTCAEDDAIFLLPIADDDVLFPVSIFKLNGMTLFRLDDLPGWR